MVDTYPLSPYKARNDICLFIVYRAPFHIFPIFEYDLMKPGISLLILDIIVFLNVASHSSSKLVTEKDLNGVLPAADKFVRQTDPDDHQPAPEAEEVRKPTTENVEIPETGHVETPVSGAVEEIVTHETEEPGPADDTPKEEEEAKEDEKQEEGEPEVITLTQEALVKKLKPELLAICEDLGIGCDEKLTKAQISALILENQA